MQHDCCCWPIHGHCAQAYRAGARSRRVRAGSVHQDALHQACSHLHYYSLCDLINPYMQVKAPVEQQVSSKAGQGQAAPKAPAAWSDANDDSAQKLSR